MVSHGPNGSNGRDPVAGVPSMTSGGSGGPPADFPERYYALLELAPDADEAAIRSAITAQRRIWRRRTTAPDIAARQEAERRMQALDDAERALTGVHAGAHPTAPTSTPVSPESSVPPQAQSSPTSPPKEPNRWLVRAVEQLEAGEADVAAFTARRAVEEDPENAYAWSVLADAAARSDDTRIAYSAIERALSLDPESAHLHAERGWILDRGGRSDQAVTAYRTAARLAPDRIDYRVRIVTALLRAGRIDEAVAEGEEAYRQRPDDGDVRTALGTALAERAVAAQHELPDGRLVIDSPSQASYVAALANRGLSVCPPDPDVRADLERQRDYARKATSRRFSMAAFRRNWRWPLGLGLLLLAGCCCAPNIWQASQRGDLVQLSFATGMTIMVLTFLGAVLYTCFEPVYRRNAALIAEVVPRRVGRGPGGAPAGGTGGTAGARHDLGGQDGSATSRGGAWSGGAR